MNDKKFIIDNYIKSDGSLSSKATRETGLSKEDLYLIVNDLCEIPKCVCGNNLKFRSFSQGYSQFCCRECSNKHKWTEESKEKGNTKRKEYYQKNPEKYLERNKKISETNKIVWASGTDLRKNQTEQLKEKLKIGEPQKKGKLTKLLKYNDPNYNNKEKYIQTCLERYGVINGRQIPGVTEKIEKTFLRKYGYKNNFGNPNIHKKAMKTRFKNSLKNNKGFILYRKIVWSLTNKNKDIKKLKNYNKRGRSDKKGVYHLDHKYSIYQGFKDNIPPFIIASTINLEFISAIKNIRKGKRCSISKYLLFKGFYEKV